MSGKKASEHAKMHGRHRRVFAFAKRTAGPIIAKKLNYSCKKNSTGDAPTIIVSNHTTNYDPILVAMAFREHMYFVASEHIFRLGARSRMIRYFFAPIARAKGQADVSTALTTMRLLKKGHNICIFAEGVRSFSGQNEPIAPATGKLVKASGAQLITFRLEGGYFTEPTWGRGVRRGRMTGHFVRLYTPEELRAMTADEINAAISRDTFEDAYESQKISPVRYRGKAIAEHLERVLYLCPSCMKLETLRSGGADFSCDCGLKAVYTEYGMLEGDVPFETITEWTDWQKEQLPGLAEEAGFSHSSPEQTLVSVNDEDGAVTLCEGTLSISRDELRLADRVFMLSKIGDMAIHGGSVLIFFYDGVHYEIKSNSPRSALLYMQLFRLFKTV